MNNPLTKSYRTKNTYVTLPSKGKYYPSGIKLSVDGDLGVYPMTVKDEITLKSPDALFNGEAMISFLKSCVPDITNPEEIPICDLDPILYAIRIANDKNMETEIICPKCSTSNTYMIDLTNLLARYKPITEDNIVKLENGIIVECKPYTLTGQLKSSIKKFETIRMEMLLNDEKYNEEEKTKIFNELLLSTAKLTIELTTDHIISVTIDDERVTKKEYIKEWTENINSITYKKIQSKINELSNTDIDKKMKFKCTNCDHNFESEIDLNPTNFFS